MDQAEELLARWLEELGFGDDPEMEATPGRVTELFRGFVPDGPPPEVGTFAVEDAGPVILRDLPFHSLCAHHLLPFFGEATIAYQPGARVAGFGALARLLAHHARRPQLQERLVQDLVGTLWDALDPGGVVVRLRARQLCMEMRGARSTGTIDVLGSRGEDLEVLRGLMDG